MPDFVLRGNNVAEMFRRRLLGVSKKVKKKLRYYRTYLRTDRYLSSEYMYSITASASVQDTFLRGLSANIS